MFTGGTPQSQQGMTLIEMLVVLTVMALLAAITALSTGIAADQSSRAQAQAERLGERLVQVFSHVELRAHLTGEVVVWSADAATIDIPDLLSIELLPTAGARDHVVFLPAQGIEPFELIVRDRHTDEALVRVALDAHKGLMWERYP